ncbi:hypothetical protein [Amycolatopsis aidingensis]|uniref:hypothetical protein n=1 Tax=Amycolatopsis aidingensis TaxID=2842453 RepID=UPI001C0C3568|nr:hypothetical protein [Amycolatopsis aidingensis]
MYAYTTTLADLQRLREPVAEDVRADPRPILVPAAEGAVHALRQATDELATIGRLDATW